MKRYLLAIILLGSNFMLHAQNGYWEEAKGPYGGNVGIVQTLTSVVYASHEYSLHRSNDYGEHWERIVVTEVDSTDYGQEELIIGPSGTFYKIISYFDGSSSITRKLFVSNDEGQTWVLTNDQLEVILFYEMPTGTLLGIGLFNGKIFRSNDGGTTWQHIYAASSGNLSHYSSDANITFDGKISIFDGLFGRCLYSENDGLSWTEFDVPTIFPNTFLSSSGTVFVYQSIGSDPVNLYRSTDLGNTWDTTTLILSPNQSLNNFCDLGNGSLLLSSSEHLYRSDDNGGTWNTLPLSTEQAYGFSSHFPLSNGDILGIQKSALVRSSNEGSTWAFSAYGMNYAPVTDLKIPTEQEQFALTNAGLWHTTDRGENWTRILVDTSTSFLYTQFPLALVNSDSFAVKMGQNLWASVDGGQSFGDLTPSGGLAKGDVFAAVSGQVFCTGVDGVLKMNSLGNTWSLVMPDVAMARFEEHPSGDFYAMTISGGSSSQPQNLWRSHDAGETWEEVTTLAIPTNSRMDLYIANGVLYVTGYFDHSIKIAISDDQGETWSYKVIPEIYTWGEIVVNDLGQIFALASFSPTKVLTSADNGDSWYYLPAYLDISLSSHLVLANGYLYAIGESGHLFRSQNPTEHGAYVRGQVNRDADLDCTTEDAQEPLKNWVIELKGEAFYYIATNENGRYTFFVDTGQYDIKAIIPQNLWWSLCDTVQHIDATSLVNSDTANFSALPLANCPLLSVNVALPQLRRCFDNQVYVEYCNQGTEPADSAWVDVTLDPYLSLISSPQPHEVQANGAIRFFVGDLPSGECGQFELTVYVSCDSTVLGQTHCIGVHGFPDTLCTIVPAWSGAEIEASVSCQDSTLQLTLQNTGVAPSQTLDYIIIEDDVVLFFGQKSYTPGESHTLNYPANGSTWRIESEQEPGHPFSYLALAFAEGCGGFESLGYINQFPVNGSSPSWHRICMENTGSFDPNDKQGFPIGTGTEHNIRPGQTIDYLIRFQNTGTDTAFTVLIRDTLSAFLDPTNIRPGASSHPYTWALSGQGVISFTFNNIALPDSNVNEPASHGFVQFSIAPYIDVPLGSVIENSAAIYFDFNEPVITNTTWHAIEKSPLSSALKPEPKTASPGLEIWPNPFSERTNIHVEKKTSGALLLKIYDSRGTLVMQKTAIGPDLELHAKDLPVGLYWAEIRNAQGQLLGNGKLVKE